MLLVANGLGRWSASLNPDGIQPHPVAASDVNDAADSRAAQGQPRNAYTFGASLGLLGTSLLYCLLAFGLLIQKKSRALPANTFIYCVAGIAGLGFVFSYLVDDYFY